MSTYLDVVGSFESYNLQMHGVRLPEFHIPEEELAKLNLKKGECSNYDFLRKLCLNGFKSLNLKKDSPEYKEYVDRVKRELETMNDLGFVDYILLVWLVMNFCEKKGIPVGFARGSSAGSLILFLIGATKIDPVKYGLFFERFISKTRAKKKIVDGITYLDGSLMCDVDMDICYYRRHEVLEFLDVTFKGKTAKILTFNSLSGKLLIKECGKVAGNKTETEMIHVASLIPKVFGKVKDIHEAYEVVPEFKTWCDNNEEIYNIALKLRDLIKNKGVHPSGILLSYGELQDSCPIELSSDKNIVSGFDMEWVSLINVKLDCLGLRSVSVVDDVCKAIGVKATEIDLTNPEIYQPLQDLKSPHGLFQIEADTAFNAVKKIKPKNLEELSGVLAIARPGAMQFLDEYASFTNTGTANSIHPFFDDIFGKTGGQCLSGETEIIDAKTGEVIKLKDVKVGQNIQCHNEKNLNPVEKKKKKVFNNGLKETFTLNLLNGSEIKSTLSHKFLTERGWKELKDLNVGDFIAVPLKIISQDNSYDLNKLRVLAYLIAEGSLASGAGCGFVSKNEDLIKEYCGCLRNGFRNTKYSIRTQIRDVSLVTPQAIQKNKYHEPNQLLLWLREIGLKTNKNGKNSTDKFVPKFVFSLNEKEIAWFLASLMDCDGGICKYAWYYKTISKQLALDVSTLFLKLGINTWIYTSKYTSVRGERTAYSIHVRNTKLATELISPYMIRLKKTAEEKQNKMLGNNINRRLLVETIDNKYGCNQPAREKVYKTLGFPDRSIALKSSLDKRLNAEKAKIYINKLKLKELEKILNVQWVEIRSIEKFGVENVYDLEVSPYHNYIANNIIVHNCLYQESLISAVRKVGFTAEEGETVRRIVGKKKPEEMKLWKQKIIDKVTENNLDPAISEILWKIAEDSANYSFNLSHSISYASLSALTVYLKFKYPHQFFLSLLKMTKHEPDPRAEITKIGQELNHFGIRMLSPDIIKSSMDFTLEDNNIRFGLHFIKGISDKSLSKLDIFRNTKVYPNKFALFQSASEAGLSISVLAALIQAGALEAHREKRSYTVLEAQLWNILKDHERENACLFGEEFNYNLVSILKHLTVKLNEKGKPFIKESRLKTIKKDYEPFKKMYELNSKNEEFASWYYEQKLMGYSCNIKLIDVFADKYKFLKKIEEVIAMPTNTQVRFVGRVLEQTVGVSKAKGTRFVKLSVSDETGTMNVLAFNDTIDEIKSINGDKLPNESNIVYVSGKKMNDAVFARMIYTEDNKIYIKFGDLTKDKDLIEKDEKAGV